MIPDPQKHFVTKSTELEIADLEVKRKKKLLNAEIALIDFVIRTAAKENATPEECNLTLGIAQILFG